MQRLGICLVLCVEIPPPSEEGGGAPEWVEMLPAGPDIEGRDGRVSPAGAGMDPAQGSPLGDRSLSKDSAAESSRAAAISRMAG